MNNTIINNIDVENYIISYLKFYDIMRLYKVSKHFKYVLLYIKEIPRSVNVIKNNKFLKFTNLSHITIRGYDEVDIELINNLKHLKIINIYKKCEYDKLNIQNFYSLKYLCVGCNNFNVINNNNLTSLILGDCTIESLGSLNNLEKKFNIKF